MWRKRRYASLYLHFHLDGFVIDRKEATDLFKEVREPSDASGYLTTVPSPGDEPFVMREEHTESED